MGHRAPEAHSSLLELGCAALLEPERFSHRRAGGRGTAAGAARASGAAADAPPWLVGERTVSEASTLVGLARSSELNLFLICLRLRPAQPRQRPQRAQRHITQHGTAQYVMARQGGLAPQAASARRAT